MKRLWKWLLNPPVDGPAETILIRFLAGGVFLAEGVMKFIFPSLGVKRFLLLGFPMPAFMSSFSGALEIVGGLLLISGFLTRLITIPLIIEMLIATLSTKISLYMGTSPLPLAPVPPQIGSGVSSTKFARSMPSRCATSSCSWSGLACGPPTHTSRD